MNQQTLRNKLLETLEKRAAGHEAAIAEVYRKAYTNIEKELLLLASHGQLKPWEIYKFDRLQKLQDSVFDYMQNLGQTETVNGLKDLMRSSYVSQCYELTASGVSAPFVMLRPEIIDAAVWNSDSSVNVIKTFKQDWVKKMDDMSVADSFLARIFEKNNLVQKSRVWDSITLGMVQGLPYKGMAKNIQEVFEKGYSDALRVLRTEGHKAQMIGQLSSVEYAVRKGVDVQDFWIASLDSKTRRSHQAMDGQKRNEDGYFIFPGGVRTVAPALSGVSDEDINCRCRIGHIVDGISPDQRRIKDPITGKYEVEDIHGSLKTYEKKLENGELKVKPNSFSKYEWLKTFDKEDASTLVGIYNDMSDEHKAFWDKNGSKLSIRVIDNTRKSSYFSVSENRITLSAINDLATTFFHEAGHFFDFNAVQGRSFLSLTEKKPITDMLRKDFKTYMKKLAVRDRSALQELIRAKSIWNDASYNSVSDLAGGITKGVVQGRSGHRKAYWRNTSMLPLEAFAHVFQAEYNDRGEKKALKEVFPTAYEFIVNLMKRELK